MDPQNIETLVTAVGGSAAGVAGAGWLARFLIKKLIRDNDRKHDLTAAALQAVASRLGDVATELAVIKVSLGQIVALKEMVAKDHDTLIEIRTWNTKYKDDLVAQFSKIRNIENSIDDISKLISSLRREASNG